MGKIPKNLSDKDMFKGWQEEPTLEEAMHSATETKSEASRFGSKRESTKSVTRPDMRQTYLSQDVIDTMEKLLLEIKLDLFKQGIPDYRVHVRREGNTILLEHVATGGQKVSTNAIKHQGSTE